MWQVEEEIINRVQVVTTKREKQFDRIIERSIFRDMFAAKYCNSAITYCTFLASPLLVLSACSRMFALWMMKQQGGGVGEAMALFTMLSTLTTQENRASMQFSGLSQKLKAYKMFIDFVNTPHIDDKKQGMHRCNG